MVSTRVLRGLVLTAALAVLPLSAHGATTPLRQDMKPDPAPTVAVDQDVSESDTPLSAAIPEGPQTSIDHMGPPEKPKVMVVFSEPVAPFTADTPSVRVNGAYIEGIGTHTLTGAATNVYLFTLKPFGSNPISFRLVARQPCESGGICTVDGAVLAETPGPHVIRYVPAIELEQLTIGTTSERQAYPRFDSDTLHYAAGCGEDGTLTLGLSAKDPDTRASVDGRQVSNRNATASLAGLDGDSVRITLSNSEGLSTTYVVHCLPDDFPTIAATRRPDAWDGLVTVSARLRAAPDPEWSYIALLDNNGVPRFHRKVVEGLRVNHFRTHRDGRYPYSYAEQYGILREGTPNEDENWEIVVLDENLGVVERVRTSGLEHTDSHDVAIRENGNYVLVAYEPSVRDLRGFKDRRDNPYTATAGVQDSVIQEITPDGAQVFLWNSWDHIPIEDCTRDGVRVIREEYAHINSVQVVDGDYVASFRSCSLVLRIDGDTGDVVWRLGKSNLADAQWAARGSVPPLEIKNDPYGEFCGQHSASILPSGNLLLFDNGGPCHQDLETGQTAREARVFSRVVEYSLDPENGTATFVRHRSLGDSFDVFSVSQGVVELMDSGNWFVSWGRGSGVAVTEVVPESGMELLRIEMTYGEANLPTRAYPVDHGAPAKAPGPLTADVAASSYNSEFHHGRQTGNENQAKVVVAFSRPVVDFGAGTLSVSVSGATVSSVEAHTAVGEPANAYIFTLAPTGDGAITFTLVGDQDCGSGGICTVDGTRVSGSPAPYVIPFRSLASYIFDDVAVGASYESAVSWMISSGITRGCDERLFCPDSDTSRQQFVTFLWRSAGRPSASRSGSDAFVDVAEGSYADEAIGWAVETGITTGCVSGAPGGAGWWFCPTDPVTRAQVATFLYRFVGRSRDPGPGGESGFVDVDPHNYYAPAVAWIVKYQIAAGCEADMFCPYEKVSRAEVATSIHRTATRPDSWGPGDPPFPETSSE